MIRLIGMRESECSFCKEDEVDCVRLRHFKDPALPEGKIQDLCRYCLEAIIKNGHGPFRDRREAVRSRNATE